MQNSNYPAGYGTDSSQLSFPNAENKNERSSRQMNLTEQLMANSAVPYVSEKENAEKTEADKNDSAAVSDFERMLSKADETGIDIKFIV